MSLLHDTDFLLHRLRLSYLKSVDDPYGPRIISLDPSYQANSYILASSLADADRWPEIGALESPGVSEEEGEVVGGKDGKEGGKGGEGGRVRARHSKLLGGGGRHRHGKEREGRRASVTATTTTATTAVAGEATPKGTYVEIPKGIEKGKDAGNDDGGASGTPRLPTAAVPSKTAPSHLRMGSWIDISNDSDSDSSSDHIVKKPAANLEHEEPDSPVVKLTVQAPSIKPEPVAPVTKVVQFIPKFKGAAEMEARRRLRMAARRGPGAQTAPAVVVPTKPLTFDSSDEEEEEEAMDSSSDDFEDVGIAITSEDIGDEFDPDFAATHTSTGMIPPPSPSPRERSHGDTNTNTTQSRHHPHRHHHHQSSQTGAKTDDTLHPRRADSIPPSTTTSTTTSTTSNASTNASTTNTSNTTTFRPRLDSLNPPPSSQELVFTKKPLPPRTLPPKKSALTAKLASSTSSNPFTDPYATISGLSLSLASANPANTSSRLVSVYFPHATHPRGKALELRVRADATVEEVVGFALWSYWEERWEPKLDEGLVLSGGGAADEERVRVRLSTVGWVLRMAEDDGEVDDDCPAPDRAKKAKDFMDIYAILEATPNQVQQNQLYASQLPRRADPLSALKKDKLDLPGASNTGATAGSNTAIGLGLGGLASFAGAGSMLSASPGLSSSHGTQVLLRVHTADAIQILTTIKVYSGTYMQEALELVCRRQRIDNPNDYVLLLADKSLVVPLDRTVASLQGKRELSLVRKSMLGSLGLKVVGRTTDPNASIFTKPKRLSENNDQELSKLDFTAAYKKFTIYRKIPMLVTRQERTLAIDGDYIHIMPSTNRARALLDSGKTASYHITTIANCSQSNKNSAIFKLILVRAATSMPKRYDFEAESPKVAADIVTSIKNLKAALDRNGTLQKSRRSRQIG